KHAGARHYFAHSGYFCVGGVGQLGTPQAGGGEGGGQRGKGATGCRGDGGRDVYVVAAAGKAGAEFYAGRPERQERIAGGLQVPGAADQRLGDLVRTVQV